MTLIFTAFYVGHAKANEYLTYIRAGQKALEATTPAARYVVLTDRETASRLERDCEVAVTAPSGLPLMAQFIYAQLAFERGNTGGVTVLAAPDCAANRNLHEALHHDFAITYRPGNTRINNIAYARDHDLAAWFLARAAAALERYSAKQQAWLGDMEAWDEALGPWEPNSERMVQSVSPEGRTIHLYPCKTHNNFVRRCGEPKASSKEAYLLHFKGERKYRMARFVEEYVIPWASMRSK